MNIKRVKPSTNLRIKPNNKKRQNVTRKSPPKYKYALSTKTKEKIQEIEKRKRKNKLVKINRSNFDCRTYISLQRWGGVLKDEPAFILGNGPSITGQPLRLLDSYFTIGVNRIFFIYEPVVLFWQDRELWRSNQHNILTSKSIRVCRDHGDPRKMFLNFKLGYDPLRFNDTPQKLYGRGNSGALAVQFAVALGCSSIVILGMDGKYGKDDKTDFYGKNPDHKPYTLKMFKKSMKWLRDKCPVPIYNCGDSIMWSKEKLEDVIEKIKPKKRDKKYYYKLFEKK